MQPLGYSFPKHVREETPYNPGNKSRIRKYSNVNFSTDYLYDGGNGNDSIKLNLSIHEFGVKFNSFLGLYVICRVATPRDSGYTSYRGVFFDDVTRVEMVE